MTEISNIKHENDQLLYCEAEKDFHAENAVYENNSHLFKMIEPHINNLITGRLNSFYERLVQKQKG